MKKNIISSRDAITLFHCFMTSAVIGWLYEVFVYYFEYHEGFVNRGFLFGPYLPVYGFGGLFSVLIFSKMKEKKIMLFKLNLTPLCLFVSETVFLTAIELITSYFLELLTGGNGFLWDYSAVNYGPEFQGRIALISSLRLGILGLICIYIVSPSVSRIVRRICNTKNGERTVKIITWVIFSVFAADALFHILLSVPNAINYIRSLFSSASLFSAFR